MGSAQGSVLSLDFLKVPQQWVENRGRPRTLEEKTKTIKRKLIASF